MFPGALARSYYYYYWPEKPCFLELWPGHTTTTITTTDIESYFVLELWPGHTTTTNTTDLESHVSWSCNQVKLLLLLLLLTWKTMFPGALARSYYYYYYYY